MERRQFLQASAAAAAVPRTVLGANDRIQVGIIGTGSRFNTYLHLAFLKQTDCTIVAGCDVARNRLDEFATKVGGKVDTYADYRRVLERKDIDAVVIATPDHWHSPMTVAACEAGKDVYVEKPVSNTIPAALKMVEATHRYKRVVQVGLQQRSWPHFQECAKMVQDGLLGTVTHAVVQHRGGNEVKPEPPQQPPPGLDWEMWQGPAPRRPYTPGRHRGWHAYYDYSGGYLTNWGVHHIDVVHWFLNADAKAPLLASASAQYVQLASPDPEQVPSAFSVSWKYDKFVMSFTNAEMPNPEFDSWGAYFHGPRGSLLVNRPGYQLQPSSRPGRPQGENRDEAAFNAKTFALKNWPAGEREAEIVHVRNWLDCIKSRQKPVCDMDTGFHSTLPTLLGLLAVRHERTYAWDTGTKTAKAV
jgi:predicted dehydrogenase